MTIDDLQPLLVVVIAAAAALWINGRCDDNGRLTPTFMVFFVLSAWTLAGYISVAINAAFGPIPVDMIALGMYTS